MADFDLDAFKRERMRDIQAKTRDVFDRGFTWSGVTVSLGARELVYYHQLGELTSLLAVTTVPAADPMQAPLTLTTLNFGAFVGAVKAYVRTIYADEGVLIGAVRVAVDRNAVEAVVDQR